MDASLLCTQSSARFMVGGVNHSPLNSSPRSLSTKSHFESPQFKSSSSPKSCNKTDKKVDQEAASQNHISLRDLMKRKLFSKLFRVLTLKDVVSGNKTYPRDYRAKHASAKRKRARSSQSSALSNFEPMPTIFEETESDLASLQSTIHHHHQYTVYGKFTNQNSLVGAVA